MENNLRTGVIAAAASRSVWNILLFPRRKHGACSVMGACIFHEVQPQVGGFRSPCNSSITLTLLLFAEEYTSLASRTMAATNRIFEYTSLSFLLQRRMCGLLIAQMAAFLSHAFTNCEHAAQSLNGDVLCIFMSASSRATGGSRRYAGYSRNGLPLYR